MKIYKKIMLKSRYFLGCRKYIINKECMKNNIISIGGATEDISLYTNEGIIIDNKRDILRQKLMAFEYGAKIRVNRSYTTFGGGAANAAVNFSGLGFKARALVCLGSDNRGKRVLKNLKIKGVNTRLTQKSEEAETGFSFIILCPEKIVFTHRGANNKLEINSRDLRAIKEADWIYLTSLGGEWPEVLNKIFSEKNIKIAWNPGHIQLKSGIRLIGKYIKKTTVFIVNKDEAIELVISNPVAKKKGGKYLNNIINLLREIKSIGPQIVVITNGKYGADAFDGVRFYHQNILREKKRVDTTGVGDAFGSSFIAGIELFKGDIEKSMRLGIMNTASVISRQGAQNGLLRRHEINELR